MRRTLLAVTESFPIAGTFTISRGAKTTAEVVTCTIGGSGLVGEPEGRGTHNRIGEIAHRPGRARLVARQPLVLGEPLDAQIPLDGGFGFSKVDQTFKITADPGLVAITDRHQKPSNPHWRYLFMSGAPPVALFMALESCATRLISAFSCSVNSGLDATSRTALL